MSEEQTINCKRRYVELLEKWRKQFEAATGGKKLFNKEFANILRLSREHFQRLVKQDRIDLDMYENLLARYILWYFATKRGVNPAEALYVFENERTHMFNIEKSGSIEEPDLDLSTLIKKQIDELRVNFDTFVGSLPAPASKTHGQRKAYESLVEDKRQKAGKR